MNSEKMQYFGEDKTDVFTAKKFWLTYRRANFDRDEYAEWFRKSTGNRETLYFRILLIYKKAFHVLIEFANKLTVRDPKRFCYKKVVPEVKTLKYEDWTRSITEFDRFDTYKSLGKEQTTSLKPCNLTTQPWLSELKKELYDPCTVTGRIVWYEMFDEIADRGSTFCSILQKVCPWKFLHVELHQSYHDIYDCIRKEYKKQRKLWEGYCLLLELKYEDSLKGVHTLFLDEEDDVAERIIIFARYTPLLQDKECEHMDIRLIDRKALTTTYAKSTWFVPEPEEEQSEPDEATSSSQEESDEEIQEEQSARENLALTVHRANAQYDVCKDCGKRHIQLQALELAFDEGSMLYFI